MAVLAGAPGGALVTGDFVLITKEVNVVLRPPRHGVEDRDRGAGLGGRNAPYGDVTALVVERTALATLGVFSVGLRKGALAVPAEIKLPDNIPVFRGRSHK